MVGQTDIHGTVAMRSDAHADGRIYGFRHSPAGHAEQGCREIGRQTRSRQMAMKRKTGLTGQTQIETFHDGSTCMANNNDCDQIGHQCWLQL